MTTAETTGQDDLPEETLERIHKIAARTATGDLRDAMLEHLRHDKTALPWDHLPEAQQQHLINRVSQAAELAVASIVRIVAAAGRKRLTGTLKDVKFAKGGVEAKFTCVRTEDTLQLALHEGKVITVVLHEEEAFRGQRKEVLATPDQPALPLAAAGPEDNGSATRQPSGKGPAPTPAHEPAPQPIPEAKPPSNTPPPPPTPEPDAPLNLGESVTDLVERSERIERQDGKTGSVAVYFAELINERGWVAHFVYTTKSLAGGGGFPRAVLQAPKLDADAAILDAAQRLVADLSAVVGAEDPTVGKKELEQLSRYVEWAGELAKSKRPPSPPPMFSDDDQPSA